MHKYEQFHEICDASPSIDDPGQWWAKMWPSGPFGSISGAPLFPQKVCKSVRFGPSGPHMSPALIDRPENGKNLPYTCAAKPPRRDLVERAQIEQNEQKVTIP